MTPRNRTSDCTYLLILVAVFSLILFSVSIAALAASIEVNSADPPEMEQSQTIDVIIKGNGFDMSAAAKFLVSGTKKTGGVTVNSTTFLDAQTLRANVTAAPDAVVGDFDIEVRLSKGRRGKGIELFKVNAKTNQGVSGTTIPVIVTFRDCTGTQFGDGLPFEPFRCLADPSDDDNDTFVFFKDRLRSDGMGSYTAGGADISANIGRADGHLRFGIISKQRQRATRRLFVDFSDCAPRGACTSTPLPPGFDPPSFSSLVGGDGSVNWSTRGIDFREMLVDEIRGDLRMGVTIDFSLIRGGQWSVRFGGTDDSDVCPGSSTVTVTRTDADTWVIEADRSDIACLTEWKGGLQKRGLYHMPFLITVECIDANQCPAP